MNEIGRTCGAAQRPAPINEAQSGPTNFTTEVDGARNCEVAIGQGSFGRVTARYHLSPFLTSVRPEAFFDRSNPSVSLIGAGPMIVVKRLLDDGTLDGERSILSGLDNAHVNRLFPLPVSDDATSLPLQYSGIPYYTFTLRRPYELLIRGLTERNLDLNRFMLDWEDERVLDEWRELKDAGMALPDVGDPVGLRDFLDFLMQKGCNFDEVPRLLPLFKCEGRSLAESLPGAGESQSGISGESCGGEALAEFVRTLMENETRRSGFSLWEDLAILWQVAKGLQYLSAKNIAHNDLHDANILIGPSGKVTIIDFGLAHAECETADQDNASQMKQLMRRIVSLHYRSNQNLILENLISMINNHEPEYLIILELQRMFNEARPSAKFIGDVEHIMRNPKDPDRVSRLAKLLYGGADAEVIRDVLRLAGGKAGCDEIVSELGKYRARFPAWEGLDA
ncbi:protein kinase domain-containing protein [Paludibacterium paludis]|uniref:Protein kinase domain-containing protein n=1 Tax=Paludibacterium paludis TaxID=1225769 RepID=A0A918P224_9NEIS|nr:protein kinase [Paludibacterium paludis]GGY13544.1 hypothetical protein GCM10011289_16080 [Paludibacterium paludis]